MIIELHQTKDGLPIIVNQDHIQVIAQGAEDDYTCVFLDSDRWLEVTETYEEIRRRLTDGIVFVAENVPDEDCKGMRC